jgi:8-oxo-dGTP pyrophosphatase MutT (NUDIX family)
MNLFINDIPVFIISMDSLFQETDYEIVIPGGDKVISTRKLLETVLVKDASEEQVDTLFKLMTKKKFSRLDSITFAVNDRKGVVDYVESKFTVIKAAGGLVEKEGQILMIHRKGKWDLPKGKVEKKESSKLAAVREVEEECNIKVERNEKLCTTWHTYIQNGKYNLKRTKWYRMSLIDDSTIAPQREEDIDMVRWMHEGEVEVALATSYRAVEHVIQTYRSSKIKEKV